MSQGTSQDEQFLALYKNIVSLFIQIDSKSQCFRHLFQVEKMQSNSAYAIMRRVSWKHS